MVEALEVALLRIELFESKIEGVAACPSEATEDDDGPGAPDTAVYVSQGGNSVDTLKQLMEKAEAQSNAASLAEPSAEDAAAAAAAVEPLAEEAVPAATAEEQADDGTLAAALQAGQRDVLWGRQEVAAMFEYVAEQGLVDEGFTAEAILAEPWWVGSFVSGVVGRCVRNSDPVCLHIKKTISLGVSTKWSPDRQAEVGDRFGHPQGVQVGALNFRC